MPYFKSRSRLAADWFAKLRVNDITQEVEHTEVKEAKDTAHNIDMSAKADTTYVDTAIGNIDVFPDQTNNAGKFLSTDGTIVSWKAPTTSKPTKFSLTVLDAVGGTLIPWGEWWVGMALCCADQACAGDTIESWMTSSCCCAGDQWTYNYFFSQASMNGYTLQTISAEGTEPLILMFDIDTLDPYGNILVSGNIPIDPDLYVDWGDGTTSTLVDVVDGELSHNYGVNATNNNYNVKVYCKTAFKFNYTINLEQYGDIEFNSRFPVSSWVNHTGVPIDLPILGPGKSVGTLTKDWIDDITGWDTSRVTDMQYLINSDNRVNSTHFRQDISGWDVGNVTNMTGMFMNARYFNAPIVSWDVSNVTSMFQMFSGCYRFNQNISNWNVSKVIIMQSMFAYALNFYQDISGWDVKNVTTMSEMFHGNPSTPPPMQQADLSAWDISNATYSNLAMNTKGIYTRNSALDQRSVIEVGCKHHLICQIYANADVSNYDISRITNMSDLFSYPLNQGSIIMPNVANWDVSRVTNMQDMFSQVSYNFNVSGWDVSSVTNMKGMFFYNTSFNQDISGWDVSSVTDMSRMFSGANLFNQNISSWQVGNVTNMYSMFEGKGWNSPSTFNQDISGWDVSSVTDMDNMLSNSNVFNQNISGWDVSNVTKVNVGFKGNALSCINSPTFNDGLSIGC